MQGLDDGVTAVNLRLGILPTTSACSEAVSLFEKGQPKSLLKRRLTAIDSRLIRVRLRL